MGAYNAGMVRAAGYTLLVALLLTGSLEAQRAGGMLQGHVVGLPARSGSAEQRGFSHELPPPRGLGNGFFPGHSHHHHHGGYGAALFPYFPPDGEAFWYGQAEPEEMTAEPEMPVGVERGDMGQWWRRELPPIKPKLIEVPTSRNATAAKVLPTVFILTDGEQVESRRFLLTANNLSVSIDRHERIIPIEMLNLDATVAANRKRGVDLRIPSDPNEISLSF